MKHQSRNWGWLYLIAGVWAVIFIALVIWKVSSPPGSTPPPQQTPAVQAPAKADPMVAVMVEDGIECRYCGSLVGTTRTPEMWPKSEVISHTRINKRDRIDKRTGKPLVSSDRDFSKGICTSPTCRKAAKIQKAHLGWDDNTCYLIAKHQIAEGFTAEQVRAGWGRPEHVNNWGGVEQWVYYDGNGMVYFDESGTVTDIQTMHTRSRF